MASSIPFAVSIQHFVNSVGADAGFAAIIGLAILVLLFFAQAREIHHLREQASEAADRARALEREVALLSRPGAGTAQGASGAPTAMRAAPSAASAAPPQPPAPTPRPAFVRATAPAPEAPAGVGAPPMAAATRLIPAVAGGGDSASARAAAAPAAAAQATAYPGVAAAVAVPPPVTPAGGANGEVRDDGRGAGTRPPRPILPPLSQPRRGRLWPRRLFAVLTVGIIVAGIVVGLLVLTGTSSTGSSGAGVTNGKPPTHRAPRRAPFRPSSVTVAVLNGTGVSGAAHRVADQLGTAGYKQGMVGNAADQTHAATIVAYLPGHREAALRVAHSLKLRAGAVQPVDPGTQQVACPPGPACTADVVVTVGTDIASQ